MNNRPTRYIWNNKFRLYKGMLRHYWQPLASLFIATIFSASYIVSSLLSSDLSLKVVYAYRNEIYWVLVLICFIRAFFTKTPAFKMNAATALYTYNSSFFAKMIQRKKQTALLLGGLLAFAVEAVVNGMSLNLQSAFNFAKLTLLFYNSCVVAWIRFHAEGKRRFIAIALFLIMIPAFCSNHILSILFVLSSVFLSSLYLRKYTALNIAKYYSKLCFLDTVMAAQAQNNYAEMIRIAEENRPTTVNGLKLQHLKPTTKTAIICKSALDIFRTQIQTYLLVIGLFVGGWLIQNKALLTFLNVSLDSSLLYLAFVLCTMMAFNTIFQVAANYALQFIDKSNAGLMLPYSKMAVFRGYIPIPTALTVLLSLVLDTLYGCFSLGTGLFALILCLLYCVVLYSKVYNGKLEKVLSSICSVLLMITIAVHYLNLI